MAASDRGEVPLYRPRDWQAPARKRKKNSLIYGADDLVSIPLKSPKKKLITSPMKVIHVKEPEKSKSETNGKSRVGDKFDNNFFEDDELEEELEDMDKSVDFYENYYKLYVCSLLLLYQFFTKNFISLSLVRHF